MPLETPARIVRELTERGYNAEREAVTLIADAEDPSVAIEAAVEAAPEDALRLTVEHVREALEERPAGATPERPEGTAGEGETGDPHGNGGTHGEDDRRTRREASADPSVASTGGRGTTDEGSPSPEDNPPISSGTSPVQSPDSVGRVPVETKGSVGAGDDPADDGGRSPSSPEVSGDITGRSTGTGEYEQFVRTFRDRYDRLSGLLRGRVNHRPAEAIADMPGGSEAAMIGLVNDIRSTANGHWLVELEDTTGTFPCLVMKDREITPQVEELLTDECIAVEGTLADDGGILFADAMHFPDVPRTFRPETADRHVRAALVSDLHVGSQEFDADAWGRFADWLHGEEAAAVEYLLVAGDMVEGVGVYPDQDEELDIVDIYEQYERFSEHLKDVPGDLEVVMVPGNHDAVRLAEPQPGFDEELREIMSAHDARITGNPSTVTVEGVSVLMYHGVSLDEVIAELPDGKASYERPHRAMSQLLKKRHVAPKYGGHTRLAPEEEDYLVIRDVPDVFHSGHVHKLGYGKYHNVLVVNSACWQAQTAFQRSVNIDPDVGVAPIVDLDTLDLTVRKFA